MKMSLLYLTLDLHNCSWKNAMQEILTKQFWFSTGTLSVGCISFGLLQHWFDSRQKMTLAGSFLYETWSWSLSSFLWKCHQDPKLCHELSVKQLTSSNRTHPSLTSSLRRNKIIDIPYQYQNHFFLVPFKRSKDIFALIKLSWG